MNKKSFWKKITDSRDASLVLVLIVLLAVIEILSPSFLSFNNVRQIFLNNALTLLMALGMLCVMLTGGIDISITSILAFAGMTVGLLQKYDVLHNTLLLFVIGAAIGLCCGMLNGIVIAKGKVAPIICTMGFMYIWRGMAYVISNNAWASGKDVSGFSDFGKDGAAGPYLILLAAYILFFIVMRWTRFGRRFYAVGSNKEAARISGINVARTIAAAYAVMGLLAGISGALSVSIYASAQPNMQYGKEMDVIAACVIGGISMNGGRGSVAGTFLGAMIIAIIAKALPLVGIDAITQNLVKGIIILAVVSLNVFTQRAINRQNLGRREI
ncbi:ABC transporter permease [Lachnoclostridium sp. Marseille-P6806]|uniref:ABC transporter permease n=1 Tax=Lachnoclostridium sp. Marseille-P6806 TaxID=2364793 RepID=UPI0010321150|nr:ABC transporter permease [Lachnoclostridium sp. Marseille-P6806]